MARRDLRPSAADHLSALAGRFHPAHAPVWDWETRTWWWRGPDGEHEVLGRDWASAHLSLDRMGRRVACAHGHPLIGTPCTACREAILSQTAESSSR
jgi:hypothetical protein